MVLTTDTDWREQVRQEIQAVPLLSIYGLQCPGFIMRRLLLLVPIVLPAIAAIAQASSSDTPRSGTLTFSGRILDDNAPLTPGQVVTIRGDVIARSESCIEARITSTQSELWLCSPNGRIASNMPDVGDPVAARARITGIKTTTEGEIPLSDSFVLMRVD